MLEVEPTDGQLLPSKRQRCRRRRRFRSIRQVAAPSTYPVEHIVLPRDSLFGMHFFQSDNLGKEEQHSNRGQKDACGRRFVITVTAVRIFSARCTIVQSAVLISHAV